MAWINNTEYHAIAMVCRKHNGYLPSCWAGLGVGSELWFCPLLDPFPFIDLVLLLGECFNAEIIRIFSIQDIIFPPRNF